MAAREFFLAVFVGRPGARGGLQNPCSAEFPRLADGQIAKGSERVSEAVAAQRQAAKFVSFARMLVAAAGQKPAAHVKCRAAVGSPAAFAIN
jgi:hypothetical protein